MKFLTTVTGIGFLAIGAAGIADEAALAELETAQALWQAAQDGDYQFEYQKFCDCNRNEPPVTVVTVTGGSITAVHHRHDDTASEVPAREGSLDLYWTVDDLFAKLSRALELEAVVRVRYDATSGYPTALFIDYDAGLVGDETDLRNIRFGAR
jgi:hypothetical protein